MGILLIFPSQMILHIFAETPTVPLLRINDSYTQRDQNAHGVYASKYHNISTFFAFNNAFNASQCYIVFWKEGSLGLLLVQNSETIAGLVLAITVLSVSVSFFSRNFIRHKRILSDSINEIAPPPLQIRNILNGNVKICFSATPHTHNTKVGKQCLTVCLRLRHFISLGLMCMKNNPFHLTLSMRNHTRIWQSLYMG